MDALLLQDTWMIVFERLLKNYYNCKLCEDFLHLLVNSTHWTVHLLVFDVR